VIPTMILFGVVFGRWPKTSLIVGTTGWPLLLLGQGTLHSAQGAVGAAALGLVNTLIGVALHHGGLRLARAIRNHRIAPRAHRG
jgi:hypothetical protein